MFRSSIQRVAWRVVESEGGAFSRWGGQDLINISKVKSSGSRLWDVHWDPTNRTRISKPPRNLSHKRIADIAKVKKAWSPFICVPADNLFSRPIQEFQIVEFIASHERLCSSPLSSFREVLLGRIAFNCRHQISRGILAKKRHIKMTPLSLAWVNFTETAILTLRQSTLSVSYNQDFLFKSERSFTNAGHFVLRNCRSRGCNC